MSLLLTNDDGIDAPGLAALCSVVQAWSTTTIVAPLVEQSGVAHRVTDSHPIAVQALGAGRFAVDGTPADCARLGLLHLAPGTRWLLSGINAGGNLGSDIYMSGTVAAAREAALLGTPAVALSQYRGRLDRPLDWNRAAGWVKRVLEHLFEQTLTSGEFWNVNLPDPDDPTFEPEIVLCPIDPGHHAVAYEQTPTGWLYRGKYRERHRRPGCDVDVCFSGNIAVSRIAIH
jgi:5'-nucleotidase